MVKTTFEKNYIKLDDLLVFLSYCRKGPNIVCRTFKKCKFFIKWGEKTFDR